MEVLIWQIGIAAAIVFAGAIFGQAGLVVATAVAVLWTLSVIQTNALVILQFITIALAWGWGKAVVDASLQRTARRDAERAAERARLEAERAAERARLEQAQAKERYERDSRRREATRRIKVFAILALFLSTMFGVPAGVGWFVQGRTDSIALGFVYGVGLLLLTTSWVWQEAAKMFASNLRWAFTAGAVFCGAASLLLDSPLDARAYWTNAGFVAISLAALSGVRRKVNRQSS